MSKSSGDDKQQKVVRALVEARDYLEFSAENADFLDNEHYLSVRNFLNQVLKEINS